VFVGPSRDTPRAVDLSPWTPPPLLQDPAFGLFPFAVWTYAFLVHRIPCSVTLLRNFHLSLYLVSSPRDSHPPFFFLHIDVMQCSSLSEPAFRPRSCSGSPLSPGQEAFRCCHNPFAHSPASFLRSPERAPLLFPRLSPPLSLLVHGREPFSSGRFNVGWPPCSPLLTDVSLCHSRPLFSLAIARHWRRLVSYPSQFPFPRPFVTIVPVSVWASSSLSDVLRPFLSGEKFLRFLRLAVSL